MPLSQPQLCNDDLTPNIMRWLRAIYARPATRACWALGRTDLARRISLLESERELIQRALVKHGNRRKQAAAELGISERTLYRKIKEFGLK